MLQQLAQLVTENHSVFLTYGPLGAVCAWLMWRAEKTESKIVNVLGDLAHRIDGLTRAMLVDMTERESAGERTREYARQAIAKIDARSAGPTKTDPR